MASISGFNQNKFKSASLLFDKIKREFKSFGDANLIDDSDFPLYVSEVLNKLGVGAFKEEEAISTVKNKKALLPKDFKQLYAAYKCHACNNWTTNNTRHYQDESVFENDITCEVLGRKNDCQISCECDERIIERLTIKRYVKDVCFEKKYNNFTLLKLSPNVKEACSENCINLIETCQDEISFNNGYILTNFSDGDIYLKYYAFPLDEKGMPLIPDIIEIEKAIEWYIKNQLILNWWLVDDLKDSVNKWQKAEAEYEKWMAEARYVLKMPSFSQMVNTIRTNRHINKVAYFSQMDRKR